MLTQSRHFYSRELLKKKLAGFIGDFRFTGQKHICAAAKKESRADVNNENPRTKRKRL